MINAKFKKLRPNTNGFVKTQNRDQRTPPKWDFLRPHQQSAFQTYLINSTFGNGLVMQKLVYPFDFMKK